MKTNDGVHEVFEGDVQYPYADIGNTDKPTLLHISEVTKENRKDYTYTCPYCKKELRPRLGKIAHCFAHKPGERCDIDKYIHTTAERLLKEKWDNEEHFRVWMNVRTECPDYETCPFRRDYGDTCFSIEKKVFDLKESYNRCEVEKKYGEFIPDLCLIDDTGKHNPIFIEIWSKHKNSEKKADSDYQIIEIRIKTIKELEELPKHMIIESDTVTFSHFKTIKKKPKDSERLKLVRYVLYADSFKSFVDSQSVNCGNYRDNHHRKSILEITMDQRHVDDSFQFRSFCDAIALSKGYNIRSCYHCQLYGSDKYENNNNGYVLSVVKGCKLELSTKGIVRCNPEKAKTCESFKLKDYPLRRAKAQFAFVDHYVWNKNADGSVTEGLQKGESYWTPSLEEDF